MAKKVGFLSKLFGKIDEKLEEKSKECSSCCDKPEKSAKGKGCCG